MRVPLATVALVVDDDPAVCRVVGRLLERQGFRVVQVFSADEALSHLARDHFDLVVSDQLMPGMTGAELLGCVRARWPSMATVLMSGVPATLAPESPRPTLRKPFSANELSMCVATVMRPHG